MDFLAGLAFGFAAGAVAVVSHPAMTAYALRARDWVARLFQ